MLTLKLEQLLPCIIPQNAPGILSESVAAQYFKCDFIFHPLKKNASFGKEINLKI